MDLPYKLSVYSSRRTNGTISNFSYNIALPNDGPKYDRVAVTSVTLIKSYYAVRLGFNTFIITELGTNRTITVPIGTYTLNAIKTVLQSLLNTGAPSGWVYAVTFPNTNISANTGKFTYTVTGNSSNQPSITVSTFMYRKLGFNKSSTNPFVGNSLTSTNYIFLNATPSLIIKTNMIDEPTSELCRVDASLVPDGGTVTYQSPHPESFAHVLKSETVKNCTFAIDDEDDNDIDLNGNEWIISLVFWESDKTNLIVSRVLTKLESWMKMITSLIPSRKPTQPPPNAVDHPASNK
jgi:hypothetical protein